MNHERDQSHAATHSGPAPDLDPTHEPGRATRTAKLDGPNGVLRSGLLSRKADGAVAPEAEHAVGAATSSVGQGLPDDLRAKFEGSLGTDLSGVRVHTGAASAQANTAVGARAYATGNDIHFAAGAYDPHSAGGQELLAHEVAHTVQQRGGSPTRQHKLEVSSPGDHAEVEADRAASAMITGASATVGNMTGMGRVIQRDAIKDNSYNRGELHWADSGSSVEEQDAIAFGQKKAELVLHSANAAAAAIGLSAKPGEIGAKIISDAVERYNTELNMRNLEIAHFESESQDGNPRQAENAARLKQCKLGLQVLIDSRESWWAHSFNNAAGAAGQVQAFVSQVTGAGNSALVKTGLLKTDVFDNVNDMSSKMTKAIEAAKMMVLLCDTTTLSNLKAHPTYDSAKAWAAHVTQTIGSLSAIGAVPGPWGPVIEGLLQAPAAVVAKFETILENHLAELDGILALARQFDNGAVILPGQSGGHPVPSE